MKQKVVRFTRCSVIALTIAWLIGAPAVSAEDLPVTDVPANPAIATAPVIISEVATGTKTSGTQEFIELYNTTDQPIDLTGWQLWYLSAQAADQNKPTSSGVIMLGENVDSPIIAPHAYYVLSGRSDYITNIARQFYGGTMAATGGNLRLLSPNLNNPCELDTEDQVGWGNALYAQGQPAVAPPAGQSITRVVDTAGNYIDTHNNAADFVVTSAPTPGGISTQLVSSDPLAATAQVLPSVMLNGCNVPVVPPPGGQGNLQQPDDDDIPPATIVPDVSQSSPAKTSASASALPAIDVDLVTPQITELLPNPAAPQADATDEFIELYNSNSAPFDLTSFSLQSGLTTKRHYVFPTGTILPPQSFTSFFSAQTGLNMSNNGGQVGLVDPFGDVINQTDVYGAAKDGLTWALANGAWYWSTTPTPNAANIITQPTTAKKAVSSKTAAAKPPTTKAVATPKTKAARSKSTSTTSGGAIDRPSQATPLHPTVLALVVVFALLYGLYEYRQDVANKLYQFRANRAARRAARTELEGG